MEDRLERPIERLAQQINILGEKIKGTQSIIPADGGSTFKKEDSPVLTPSEKSRERQKAIEFGKALGIGNYAPKGKLEDLTPTAVRATAVSSLTPAIKKTGMGLLGIIGKAISTVFNILSFASLYKIVKPYIEKWFGKNALTDALFGIMDPLTGFIESIKQKFTDWFKDTFPATYETITSVIDSVKGVFNWIWEKIQNLFGWAKDFFKSEDKKTFLADTWENIKTNIKAYVEEKLGTETLNSISAIWNSLSTGLDTVLQFINGLMGAPDKMQFLSESWESVKSSVKDWFKSIGMKFTDDSGKELGFFDALIQFVRDDLYEKHLKKHVEQIFSEIGVFVKNLIGEERVNKFNKIIDDLSTGIADAKEAFKEIKEFMKDPLGYLASKAGEAIANMAKDTWSNIKELVPKFEEASKPLSTTPYIPTMLPTGPPGLMMNLNNSLPTGEKPKSAQPTATFPTSRVGAITKKADDFLVSKRGDFVNFSNQDNILGFKDGGSVDRVLGRKDDVLITDTKQILLESRKQVSLLQKIVENTYNANLLLQKLNNRPTQQPTNTGTRNLIKFNRTEFDIETSPSFNFGGNLATI